MNKLNEKIIAKTLRTKHRGELKTKRNAWQIIQNLRLPFK